MWVLGISRKVLARCMMLQKDKTRKEERRETPCSYRTWRAEQKLWLNFKKMDYSNYAEVTAAYYWSSKWFQMLAEHVFIMALLPWWWGTQQRRSQRHHCRGWWWWSDEKRTGCPPSEIQNVQLWVIGEFKGVFEIWFILDVQDVSMLRYLYRNTVTEFTCMLVRRSRIPPTAMQDKAGKSSSENTAWQRETNLIMNLWHDYILIIYYTPSRGYC